MSLSDVYTYQHLLGVNVARKSSCGRDLTQTTTSQLRYRTYLLIVIFDSIFPVQIVPFAVKQLCRVIPRWSSLRRLELSNIAFHNDGLELAQALTDSPHINGAGPIQIVIRQAVFMLPISVLHIVLGVPALRELHLIDVYQHSIWGPRLRIADVQDSLLASEYMSHMSEQDCLERLREVVSCVVKTERLMGGDREHQ